MGHIFNNAHVYTFPTCNYPYSVNVGAWAATDSLLQEVADDYTPMTHHDANDVRIWQSIYGN